MTKNDALTASKRHSDMNTQQNSHFRWVVVGLLFVITIFNYIDRSAIAFAIEKIQLDTFQSGLILGGFGLGYAVMTFLGGIWVDRYGAKKVLSIAVIFWAISMFITAAASGFFLIFISRIILGVAEGPNFPSMTRAVADWLPVQERTISLAYALMAVPIAIALGGPVVSQLIIHFGWRGMFVVLGVVVLLWLPLWFYYFSDKPEESKFVAKKELDLIDQEKSEMTEHDGSASPNIWRYLLSNKTLLANYWAFFVFGYFLFFFMTWLPSYLKMSFHMDLKSEGLFTMLPWLLAAVLMWLVSHLSDWITRKTGNLRLSRSWPIMTSQLLASLCVIPLVFMEQPSLTTTMTLISLAVGFILSVNPNYYAVNIDMAKARAGTALGIMDTGFAIAGFLAPVLTGYLVSVTHTFKAGFLLMAVLGLSSVIVVGCFHRPGKVLQ